MLPLARWTIGPSTPQGYKCLLLSIQSFLSFYEAEVVVCHNCPIGKISHLCFDNNVRFIEQTQISEASQIPATGVAWKLYPPRIDPSRHELSIDNDIVFEEPIPEIDKFLQNDCTLLLQDESRTYGRFEKHVPAGYEINSGIYGMPPYFSLEKYIRFYCNKNWEVNALGEYAASKTFDEQGLIALALLDYDKHIIIPKTSVTNCERELVLAKAMHFIGLNRKKRHSPFLSYKNLKMKLHI